MWPALAVMLDVAGHEAFELASVPDDGAIEELPPDRTDPAFSEGVGDRRADGCVVDLESLGSAELVEYVNELAVTVANKHLRISELIAVAHTHPAQLDGG